MSTEQYVCKQKKHGFFAVLFEEKQEF